MSALGGSSVLPGDHGSPGDLDDLGLKCTPTDADTREVESLGIDAHKREKRCAAGGGHYTSPGQGNYRRRACKWGQESRRRRTQCVGSQGI